MVVAQPAPSAASATSPFTHVRHCINSVMGPVLELKVPHAVLGRVGLKTVRRIIRYEWNYKNEPGSLGSATDLAAARTPRGRVAAGRRLLLKDRESS